MSLNQPPFPSPESEFNPDYYKSQENFILKPKMNPMPPPVSSQTNAPFVLLIQASRLALKAPP